MALSRAAALDIRKTLAKRVVGLYRRMCREVIPIRTMYQIDETPAEIRHMVLLQFRQNQKATDPRIIDTLVAKGEMELQEARQQWKQRGHLMALIKPDLSAPDPLVDSEEFFRRFLDGTLDESSIWRGHKRSEQTAILKTLAAQIAAAEAPPPLAADGKAGAEPWAEKVSSGQTNGSSARLS